MLRGLSQCSPVTGFVFFSCQFQNHEDLLFEVKNPPVNARDGRDVGSISGVRVLSGVGNGSPLQYCCLGNPTDRGAREAKVHGAAKSWT